MKRDSEKNRSLSEQRSLQEMVNSLIENQDVLKGITPRSYAGSITWILILAQYLYGIEIIKGRQMQRV